MILSIFRQPDRLNRIFSAIWFATPAIAGSLGSVLIVGACLHGLVRVLFGSFRMARDRSMVAVSAALGVYCAAQVVALLLSPMDPHGLRHLYELAPLLLFPFLYSAWRMSHKEPLARVATQASAIACLGAGMIAAFEVAATGMRAGGAAGNANVFALLTTMAVAIVVAGLLSGVATRPRLCQLALPIGIAAILATGARTAWLALALTGIALWLAHRDRWSAAPSRILTGLGVALGALLAAAAAWRGIALWQDIQALQEGNLASSLGYRLALWRVGLDLVAQSPLVGHGPQATTTLIHHGLAAYGIDAKFTHFHNGLLTALVEAGPIAALALAGLFVATARGAVRGLRSNQPGERFGGSLLLAVTIVWPVNGMTGLMISQDLLDTTLLGYLAVGCFLADGVSDLSGAAPAQAASRAG